MVELNKKYKFKNLKLQQGDIVKTHGSNKKLEKIIGKIKFTNVNDGVKNFVKWYKNYFNLK